MRFGYGARWELGRCHTEDRLPSGHTSIMDPAALVTPIGSHPRSPAGSAWRKEWS